MTKITFYLVAVLLFISSDFSFTSASNINAEQKICKNHTKPMDCGEVLDNGNTESGIYTIWPRSRVSKYESLEVYCDMETAGGGWTVIQRRGDFGNAQNYFDKTWKDYKDGFGNLKREFWLEMKSERIAILKRKIKDTKISRIYPTAVKDFLSKTSRSALISTIKYIQTSVSFSGHVVGSCVSPNEGNDIINVITNQGKYSARFDMRNKERKYAFAVYDTFYIDEERTKYQLHIAQYSGNAGDAISTHNYRLFYTKDQHNIPPDRKKSSLMHTGGWWFNVFPSSNLNALNNNGEKHKVVEQGIAWSTFGRYSGVITFTEIKIRLKNQ